MPESGSEPPVSPVQEQLLVEERFAEREHAQTVEQNPPDGCP
jgi:hypothetical protein